MAASINKINAGSASNIVQINNAQPIVPNICPTIVIPAFFDLKIAMRYKIRPIPTMI